VGQDKAGHWLVQASNGQLEGRFVSFDTAMAFARSEQPVLPHATIVLAVTPLVPIVSFAPVAPWESAQPQDVAA
jgi:hypothetical protein